MVKSEDKEGASVFCLRLMKELSFILNSLAVFTVGQ
jgi:hypothetical protein